MFGGTFDPIHIGHLASASEAMWRLRLDEVLFVPALPSHKPAEAVTDAEHRFAMVLLAVSSNPKFSVSRVDIDRGKPTYTIDTLTDLRAAYGDDADLFFITGADVIAQLPTWSSPDELRALAEFVGVSRSGHGLSFDHLAGWLTHVCELPELAMSSSEIRRRVAADEPVWYWVPEAVLNYIGKHGLYGADWGYGTPAG